MKQLTIDEINSIIENTVIDDRQIRYDDAGAKISETRIGRVVHTPEARAKLSAALKGYPISQERRDKISKANTGVPLSDERRAKISARMSKYMYHTPNGVFETMQDVVNSFPDNRRNQLNKWFREESDGFYRMPK